MTPQELASIHRRCFDLAPRPWTAAEFEDLLRGTGVFLLTRPHGFLMGRAIAGEAELLTLAVDPMHRRKRVGAELIAEFADAARARAAESCYLEVAADNGAALALYRQSGWIDTGRRRNYYRDGLDALTLRLEL